MLKSTNSQTNKLKLLCNQLDHLNLIYHHEPKRTTTTRITPRGPQPRKMEVYKLLGWNKAKMFPPNWKNDHHIFYPSLKEVLLKKQLDEYRPENYVNLGVQYVKKEVKKERVKRRDLKLKKLESKQDLLDLVNVKSSNVQFDYDRYHQTWLKSEAGLQEVSKLAHHYELFRDLFLVPRPVAQPAKKVDFDDLFPRPEQIYELDLEKYFPGSIKFDMNERDDYYYFDPVVPVYAEFVNKQDELSQVYRGNLVEPAYASSRPNIVLDTSFFTDQNPDKIYEKLVQIDRPVTLTDQNDQQFYTVALLNLDNVFLDQRPICNYLVANIRGTEQEECMSYLPVYGVKGLGYHRYVFVVFRHEKKLQIEKVNDFDLNKRLFNAFEFVKCNEAAGLKPVGLNWFQSRWDETCKSIFHDVLRTRMPVYEYIQNREIKNKQVKIPAPAAFNHYLDRFRDPKEIEKEVLLERLNSLDPFDCESAIKEPDLPPNIHKLPWGLPSWLKSSIWKRNNRFGKFRGLRAPSALIPHNNNPDLGKFRLFFKFDLFLKYKIISFFYVPQIHHLGRIQKRYVHTMCKGICIFLQSF